MPTTTKTPIPFTSPSHRPAFTSPNAKRRLINHANHTAQDIESILRQNEEAQRATEEKARIEAEQHRMEQLRQEADQRIAAANILNGHLLMVEIMMSSIVHRYAHQVYSTLNERGMLRHNIKRQATQLRSVATELMSRCKAHDLAYVEQYTPTFTHRWCPPASKPEEPSPSSCKPSFTNSTPNASTSSTSPPKMRSTNSVSHPAICWRTFS